MNMKRIEGEGIGDNDGFFECVGTSAATLNSESAGDEAIKNTIDAIKLIAAAAPKKVNPFSMGDICGVKIMSVPTLGNNMIMVSDDIYLLLKEIADNQLTSDHVVLARHNEFKK